MNNKRQRKHVEVIITCKCGRQLKYHIGKPCPVMPFVIEPCPNCTKDAQIRVLSEALEEAK